MIMEETGKIFKKEKEMKKGEALSGAGLPMGAFCCVVPGWGNGHTQRCRGRWPTHVSHC